MSWFPELRQAAIVQKGVQATCDYYLGLKVGLLDPVNRLFELRVAPLIGEVACMDEYIALRQFGCLTVRV